MDFLLSAYGIIRTNKADQKGKLFMPTQEKRITTFEQTFATYRKVTAIHFREVDENNTIMLGVMRDRGRDIKRMVQHLESIDERLNALEKRFDTLEPRFDILGQRFDTPGQRFEASEKKLDQVLYLLTTITNTAD